MNMECLSIHSNLCFLSSEDCVFFIPSFRFIPPCFGVHINGILFLTPVVNCWYLEIQSTLMCHATFNCLCGHSRQLTQLRFGSRLHGALLHAHPARGAAAVSGQPTGVAGQTAPGQDRLQPGECPCLSPPPRTATPPSAQPSQQPLRFLPQAQGTCLHGPGVRCPTRGISRVGSGCGHS